MTALEDAFKEAEDFAAVAEERDQLRDALWRTQAQLKKSKLSSDLVAVAASRGARDAVLARPPVPVATVPKDLRRKGAEVALWHMTDWQGHKKTTSYDGEVMAERAHRFVDRALSIAEIQRADHPVKDCYILFGGDMIEGLFNFPTQVFEIDATLFQQFVHVAEVIDQIARRAASFFENVHIIGEWGNHGRLGSKRDAVPKHDNADRMTYELAATMGRDVKNLHWHERSAEDIQQVEIGNYRALLIHGDEVGRGGFASPMTIVAHVNRWKSGAWPWDFRDVYIGHYHQHQEWNLANGNGAVYMSGSLESDNRYAREGMASSAKPSQRLHFIDPRKGRVTAQYKVWVEE